MLTLRSVSGPCGPLGIDDTGSGEHAPVLFVHADAGNATQWREALDQVRPQRRAVALDLRGCGRSAHPADGDHSIGARADDVAAVVKALGLEQVILVGHSGGALVALHYAAQHAAQVAGLLLVDPANDGRQFPADKRQQFMQLLRSPQYSKTARDYYTSIAGANADVRDRVLWDLQAASPDTVIGTFEALASYDPLPALKAYVGPRLMLVTPASDTPASIRRLDPTLRFQTIEHTGHWIQLDDPIGFADTLKRFSADLG